MTLQKSDNNMNQLQIENEQLKQQIDILTIDNKKRDRLEDSLFSPKHFEHYMNIARIFSKSGLTPKAYIGKPDDCFIAMSTGYQLGLSIEQSLQDIAVINGRPVVWGDGMLAIVMGHPSLEYIKENLLNDDKGNIVAAQCIIKRRGHEEHSVVFSIDDAKKAGLLNKPGPWTQYPTRMLQMRARGWACRDKFPDALRGIKMAEEVNDYIEGEVVPNRKSTPTKAQDRLNNLLQSKGTQNAQPKIVDITPQENNPVNYQATHSKNSKETAMDNESQEMGAVGIQKTVSDDPNDSKPITDELLDEISGKMTDVGFDSERMTKALNYFEVDCIESMTIGMAKRFLKMLERPVKN